MSTVGARYMGEIKAIGCILCRRFGATGTAVEVHHIAEGSGKRNDFATAPLCAEHHRGSAGIHGMGTKAFCALYRPPGDCEWGLLTWTNEDRSRFAAVTA